MTTSKCSTVLSLLFHSMFLSVVELWKFQYILYTSKEESLNYALYIAKKLEKITIETHFTNFIKNNDMEHLVALLKSEECCFSGGTVVKILHGEISKIHNLDLDIFIKTPHHKKSEKFKMLLSKYGSVYSTELLYKTLVSHYRGRENVPSTKIEPLFLEKMKPKHVDYDYSNFLILKEPIAELVLDDNKTITSYIDVTVVENHMSFETKLDLFDIDVCSSMVYFDAGQIYLYVKNRSGHVFKAMKGLLQYDIREFCYCSHHHTVEKKIIEIVRKHLLRLEKYMDRGFACLNKSELFRLCLCVWQNHMAFDDDYEHGFFSLVEKLTHLIIDLKKYTQNADEMHCVLIPEYMQLKFTTDAKRRKCGT